jgi:hypothetical protein
MSRMMRRKELLIECSKASSTVGLEWSSHFSKFAKACTPPPVKNAEGLPEYWRCMAASIIG